jgi:hypothetical protein
VKSFSTFCVALSLFLLPNIIHAETDDILSETVKIISFNLTNNNHVIEKTLGSATIISEDGLLLTNNHVVTDENDEPYEAFAICVVTDAKERPECTFTASIIAKDKKLDAALMRIDSDDIFGNPTPKLPFLKYEGAELPPEEEDISLIGFPGVGGETITITEGQISGYDEKEGIKQIKTDAVISPGNSGGTAKNKNGDFIGIPTYLRSYFGTLGYIVPLAEILPWLLENEEKEARSDIFARSLLQKHLQKVESIHKENSYTSDFFPFYSVEIKKPWKLSFVNNAELEIEATVQGHLVYLSFSTASSAYDLNEEYMEFLLKKIEKNQHNFTNYQRKEHSLAGTKGYLISYDSGQNRNHYFLAPIENMLFTYSYSISLENITEMQEAVNDILSSFRFLETPNNTITKMTEYSQRKPDVELNTPETFYISPVYDSKLEDSIVYIENPDSFEQNLRISRKYFPKDYWGLQPEAIMEKELKYIGSRLINQYDDVTIDGLPGYAYTVSYKGDDFEQTKKKTTVILFQDEKRYFEFIYDDLAETYDKNIGLFREVLERFSYNGEENASKKGHYNIPAFTLVYKDTKYHVYEQEINALTSKKILEYQSQNYYPESPMSRMKAIEAIFNGKIFVEEGRNLMDTKIGIEKTSDTSVFADIPGKRKNKLLRYAISQNIIHQKPLFRPKEGITLAESLKILCRVFELPVWNPPYSNEVEWYIPYVYRGQLLGVIPSGADHETVLSRGQFSALLYNFIRIVGERSDL